MGPSGFGSGGGITVFSPDTLDGGHWAAGARITYTRPERRSDAELKALNPKVNGADEQPAKVIEELFPELRKLVEEAETAVKK